MNRKECVHQLLKNRKTKVYVEIGVSTGRIFFDIKSTTKYGVDPLFKFSWLKRFRRTLKNLRNVYAKFYPVTSDDFFARVAPRLFAKNKIDICLIDGFHEFPFALRDIENTLNHLKENGVILVHDCNPTTKEKASSFEEWENRKFNGEWNGDVWKAIVYLRSTRNDINIFVLDCDYGLGIITKGKPENNLPFAKEEINSLPYEEFEKNRLVWLNLKAPEYFYQYFNV